MMPIIGHADTLAAFDRLIASQRLGHAYFLVGPEGVGKATVTRWIAKRLLCSASRLQGVPPPHAPPPNGKGRKENGQTGPCGECVACQQVERSVHPDLFVLRPVDRAITIDAVREWTTALSRTSLFAGWKIGILEGANELTEAAANACLKVIEEPTPQTLILLTAPSRRQVMATIASRCALVVLRRVPTHDLEVALRERGAVSAEASAIAGAADGCPGIALTLLKDPEYRRATEELHEAARAATSGSWTDRLRRIDALLRDRGNDRTTTNQSALTLIEAFRSLGRQQLRSTGSATPEFSRWMELLARAPRYLQANVNLRLLLETIAVTYPGAIGPRPTVSVASDVSVSSVGVVKNHSTKTV